MEAAMVTSNGWTPGVRPRHRQPGDGTANPRRRGAWRAPVVAVLAAASLAAAGCGSGSPSSSATSGGGPIKVGVIGPMTGPAAEIGTLMMSACYAAVHEVSHTGGPLGSTVSCDSVDDTGDPADAVPNVSRALATTSNLAMAVGLESNTAATTVPIVNKAAIPMFSTDGLVSFDKTTLPYFWRMTPADDQNGAAFGLWALRQGYKRAAIVFQNNIGAQGNEPGVVAAYRKKGGTIAINLTIPGDVNSYSSTVQRVINAHPQVLITAADPQTSATFLSEYKQLNGGSVPPIVTATDSLTPDYFNAIKKVLGAAYVTKHIALVGSYINPAAPAYTGYKAAMYASPQVKSPATVLGVGVISSIYDGIIIMSLAMQEAHSTKGSAYNKDILSITTAGTGKQVVHSYAAGLAAIKAGHKIQYVGVGGPIAFDRYHNSPGQFSATAFNADGSPRLLGVMTGPDVLALLG
jgi:branched-chain amino acid transport system substrate-binding protein